MFSLAQKRDQNIDLSIEKLELFLKDRDMDLDFEDRMKEMDKSEISKI